MGSKAYLLTLLNKYPHNGDAPREFIEFMGFQKQPPMFQNAAWKLTCERSRFVPDADVWKHLEQTQQITKEPPVNLTMTAEALERLIGKDAQMNVLLSDAAVREVLEKHLHVLDKLIEEKINQAAESWAAKQLEKDDASES